MTSSARDQLTLLRRGHDRLFELVVALTPDELSRQSYCRDWCVADVLSHLGSGAEIFKESALAGMERRPAVEKEEMEAIWRRWDALSPVEKAERSARCDDDFLVTLEELDEESLEAVVFVFPDGRRAGAKEALALRLTETTIHSWDVEVTFEPSARLRPEAVGLLLDRLATSAPRWGEAAGWDGPPAVVISTSEPARQFLLSVGDGVSWSEEPEPGP